MSSCHLAILSIFAMGEEQAQPGHILTHVLAFTHLLREMGVDVSPGQALELVRALEYAPITSREDFRGAARCTLIRRHEDLPLFDTAFAFYWRAGGVNPLSMLLPQVKVPPKPLRLRQPPPRRCACGSARARRMARMAPAKSPR